MSNIELYSCKGGIFTVLRLIPVNIYDFPQVEAYFSHMAQRGLFIKKVTNLLGFAHFERGNGEETKYHLEPIGNTTNKPFDELKSQYEEAGWEYICNLESEFYIFKAITEETKEVQPNPFLREKELKNIKKKHLSSFIYILLY